MPQKLNKAGKMQDYIPAGNGDPSGEYGTSKGTNKNFTKSDKKKSQANVITDNKSVVVENKGKEKEKPFDIDTLDVSLRKSVENGKMTLKEASIELAKAGWYNYIPDEEETKRRLKLNSNKANIIDNDLTGKKSGYDDSDIRNMDESEFDGVVSTKELWENTTNEYEKAKPILDKMGIKIEDVKFHKDRRTKDDTDNIDELVYQKTGTYSGRTEEEKKAIMKLADKVYLDKLTREFKMPKKTNKIQ